MAISQLPAAQVERHVQSVRDVPHGILPVGRARNMLESLARSGLEVYAYTHNGGETIHRWYVWLGPLSAASADGAGQVTMVDWIQQYDTLYTVVNVLASLDSAPQTGGAA